MTFCVVFACFVVIWLELLAGVRVDGRNAMEAILKMLEEHIGKWIQIEVGADKIVDGILKQAFPEYVVVQVKEGSPGLGRIVLMSQIRWFELIPDHKPESARMVPIVGI